MGIIQPKRVLTSICDEDLSISLCKLPIRNVIRLIYHNLGRQWWIRLPDIGGSERPSQVELDRIYH